MLLLMNTGEVDLFLLSEQPRGGFQGAVTTFCQQGYFAELPDDLASEGNPYGCDLSQAPFWEELGIEDIAFYGCILDNGNEKQFRQGISVLEQLMNAHVTLW